MKAAKREKTKAMEEKTYCANTLKKKTKKTMRQELPKQEVIQNNPLKRKSMSTH